MHELTKLIKDDMIKALGVTEPGAIAFAVSKAKSYSSGNLKHFEVKLNSGMYKNAYTCGIPNSDNYGIQYAAALGYVAGDYNLGLESLRNVKDSDNKLAEELVNNNLISTSLDSISSKIYIEINLETSNDRVKLIIKDTHTNIVKIVVNDQILLDLDSEKNDVSKDDENVKLIHKYTLDQIINYVDNVSIDEISFVKEAYDVNLELFEEAINNQKTTFAKSLYKSNGNKMISESEKDTAMLLCASAIEARVIGLNKPAMSITGSGAHGIIATLPLYAVYKINNYSDEKLYRATMLSYLICTYIKEYSGKLSAFCGCGIAAGTGMAMAVTYLKDGDYKQIEYTLNNMAASITGMICDGGNQGCTMKAVAACDTAFRSVEFALNEVFIDKIHGIIGNSAEDTMKNIGLIASPGMIKTEETIVDIFKRKS
jgi:L-cysteine desulfidase